MSKKIVFVNQATGYITIDIINEFTKEYDETAVIYGGYREQDIPLNPSVSVSEITGKSRSSNIARALKWLFAAIQIHYLLITKYRDYEIFYFTVPPFSYFSSLFIRRKFSVMIFDVYPDVLKNFGMDESNFIYKIWDFINRKVLQKAHRIYTIGDSLAEIIQKYIPSKKIDVIPLWTGLTDAKPLKKKDNIFAIEHNLTDKFVVQYSGNIGHTHDIETLVDVARNLQEYKDISFLIIGRGTKFDYIKNIISEYNLENCKILPFQPDKMIKYSLAVADVGVVVVGDKNAQMSIPSKIYNIMAVGSALLCIAPDKSEVSKMVKKYRNGESFSKNNIEGIANYILRLKNNRDILQEYKNNSYEASGNFTKENATDIFNTY